MQPEFSSFTWMPASRMKPPSMPISPNSFSMSTSFSPPKASWMSFLIRVVLPAPKKPEKISILVCVIFVQPLFSVLTNTLLRKKSPAVRAFVC